MKAEDGIWIKDKAKKCKMRAASKQKRGTKQASKSSISNWWIDWTSLTPREKQKAVGGGDITKFIRFIYLFRDLDSSLQKTNGWRDSKWRGREDQIYYKNRE